MINSGIAACLAKYSICSLFHWGMWPLSTIKTELKTQLVVGGQILGLCRLICSLFCYGLNSKYYIVDINNLWKYFTAFEKACSNLSSLPTSFSCLMKPDNLSVDCGENWQNNFIKIEATSQFLPLTWYKVEQCLPDFFSICGKHWWNSYIKMMWASRFFLISIFFLALKFTISVF